MINKLIRAVIIIVAVTVILALLPYQWGTIKRDGGSRVWKSLTWEVMRYHQYNGIEQDGSVHVDEGWLIEVFGYTLRDDAENFFPRWDWVEVTW